MNASSDENSAPSPEQCPTGEEEGSLLSRPAPSTIQSGGISRTIWRLALPTWGAFVLLNLMGIIDMFFVGKLGPAAVAAVTMGGIMIGIVVMLALGVAMGTTALVANAFGRDDPEDANAVTAQGLTIAVFLAAFLASICLPLAPVIIQAMGGSPEVVAEGATYLRIVAGGGIALLVQIALGAALRGAGDAITPMKAMISAIIVNMVLDPILIFGMFGFPALGVAGSAWATVIGRGVATLLMVAVLLSDGRSPLSLKVHQMAPRIDIIKRIFRIGIFASGRALLRNISRLALMRLAAMFGTPAVAAFGICFRLQMLILGPGNGFGTAAATMVGQNLGAGQPERGERSGWIAAGTAMAVGVGFTALFWGAPHLLIRVFNRDPEVVRIGVNLLRWFAGSFPLLLGGFVLGQAMTGAGDSLRPMLITGVSQVLIGLPLAGTLAARWESAEGIWVGFFVGNILMGVLSAAVFYRGKWKTVDVTPAELPSSAPTETVREMPRENG